MLPDHPDPFADRLPAMTDNQPQKQESDLAALIAALTRQAEASALASERIESRVLPLLERIAIALERSPMAGSAGQAPGIAEFRLALREHRWEEADEIARDLARAHPEDPENLALADQADQARREAATSLRDRIEAARQAGDPEGVLTLHRGLSAAAASDSLKDFDADLVKWLMTLIHKRLRGGTIRPDLADLVAKVAEQFVSTPEGASLKASLPTLRRSAGLCPRCGEVYPGLADACPKCLGSAFEEPPTIELPPATPAFEAEEETDPPRDPFDLNNSELWQDP